MTVKQWIAIIQRYCQREKHSIKFYAHPLIREKDHEDNVLNDHTAREVATLLTHELIRERYDLLIVAAQEHLNEGCPTTYRRLADAIKESKAVLSQTTEKNDET